MHSEQTHRDNAQNKKHINITVGRIPKMKRRKFKVRKFEACMALVEWNGGARLARVVLSYAEL